MRFLFVVVSIVLFLGTPAANDVEATLKKVVELLSASDYERRRKGRELLESLWRHHAGLALLRRVQAVVDGGGLTPDCEMALEAFLLRHGVEMAQVCYGGSRRWLLSRPHLVMVLLGLKEPDEKRLECEVFPAAEMEEGEDVLAALVALHPHNLSLWKALRSTYATPNMVLLLPRLKEVLESGSEKVLSLLRGRFLSQSPTCRRVLLARAEREGKLSFLRGVSKFLDGMGPEERRRFYRLLFGFADKIEPADNCDFRFLVSQLGSAPKEYALKAAGYLVSFLKAAKLPEKLTRRILSNLLTLLEQAKPSDRKLLSQVHQFVCRLASQKGLTEMVLDFARLFEGDERYAILRKALERSRRPGWRCPFSDYYSLSSLDAIFSDPQLDFDLLLGLSKLLLREPVVLARLDSGVLKGVLRRLAWEGGDDEFAQVEQAVVGVVEGMSYDWSACSSAIGLLESGVLSEGARRRLFRLLLRRMGSKFVASWVLRNEDAPRELKKKALQVVGQPVLVDPDLARSILDFMAAENRYSPDLFSGTDLALMSVATVDRLLLQYILDERSHGSWPWELPLGGSERVWMAAALAGLDSLKNENWNFIQACRLLALRTRGRGWEPFFDRLFSMLAEGQFTSDSLGTIDSLFYRLSHTPYRKRLLRAAYNAFIRHMGEAPIPSYLIAGANTFIGTEFEGCFAEVLAWLLMRGGKSRDSALIALSSGSMERFRDSPPVRRLLAALWKVGRNPAFAAVAAEAFGRCAPSGVAPLSVLLDLPPGTDRYILKWAGECFPVVTRERVFLNPEPVSREMAMEVLRWVARHLRPPHIPDCLMVIGRVLAVLLGPCGERPLPKEAVETAVEAVRAALKNLPQDKRKRREVVDALLWVVGALGPDLPQELFEKVVLLLPESRGMVRNMAILKRARAVPRMMVIRLVAEDGEFVHVLFRHPGVSGELRQLLLRRMIVDPDLVTPYFGDLHEVVENVSSVAAGDGPYSVPAFCALCSMLSAAHTRGEENLLLPLYSFIIAWLRGRNAPLLEEFFFHEVLRGFRANCSYQVLDVLKRWFEDMGDGRLKDFLEIALDEVYYDYTPNFAAIVLCYEALMRDADFLHKPAIVLLGRTLSSRFGPLVCPVYRKGDSGWGWDAGPAWVLRMLERLGALVQAALQNQREPSVVSSGVSALTKLGGERWLTLPHTVVGLTRNGSSIAEAALQALTQTWPGLLSQMEPDVAMALAECGEGLIHHDDKTGAQILAAIFPALPPAAAKHTMRVLLNAALAPDGAYAADAFITVFLSHIKDRTLFEWAKKHLPAIVARHGASLTPSFSNPKNPFAMEAMLALLDATGYSPLYTDLQTDLFLGLLQMAPARLPERVRCRLVTFLLRARVRGSRVYSSINYSELAAMAPFLDRRYSEAVFLLTCFHPDFYRDVSYVVEVLFAHDLIPSRYHDTFAHIVWLPGRVSWSPDEE